MPVRAPELDLPVSRPSGATADSFGRFFDATLESVLDLNTWHPGTDLVREYARVEAEIARAVADEGEFQHEIRERVLGRLAFMKEMPEQAGHYRVPERDIIDVQQGLLFNGGTEACDGTTQVHDTLALTVYQIGVALVSYRGDQGSWSHRLFRRDLRETRDDSTEALESCSNRARRERV